MRPAVTNVAPAAPRPPLAQLSAAELLAQLPTETINELVELARACRIA